MREFHPDLEGTPSVRIGPRIPSDAVGLAYVSSPEFTADKIEVLDLSRRIPENVALQHDVEADMFVGEDRLLRDLEGRSSIPLEEIIVTNEYLRQGEKMVPLFWKGVSRHYHYEPGAAEGDYAGDKIRIAVNRENIEEPYRIRLVSTETEHVFKVEVLCGFRFDEGKAYRLHYHRCDKDGKNQNPGHSEILNTVPLFSMTTKEEVLESPLNAKIYSVTLDQSEGGFHVHVPETTQKVNRSPIWIRWRITSSNNRTSPWFCDLLYHKNSLHPEEMEEHGKKVYVKEGSRAYKILCPNVSSLFAHTAIGNFQFEYQIWNGSAWENDSGLVHMRLKPIISNLLDILTSLVFQGRVTGYRLEAAVTEPVTGDANLTPGIRGIQSVAVPFQVKVAAYEDKPGTAPQVIYKDVASEASVSWDLNTSLFPEHSSPDRVIDGIPPAGISSFLFGTLDPFFTKAYAFSKEQISPPTNITTITLDLPEAKELDRIQVYLGNYGKPEWVRIEHNQTTTTVWDASTMPSPTNTTIGDAKRLYERRFSSPVMAKKIQIGIRPDKWFVRPVYTVFWFIFKFSFYSHDAYKSGFEVVQISALERSEIPGTTPWSSEKSLHGSTIRQAPFRMSARELIEILELLPPQGVDKGVTRYRIELSDPDHRLNLKVYKNATLLPLSDGAYVIDHSDLDSVFIEITTPDYELSVSPRFSVRSEDPGNLFVLPPTELESDSVWRVRVNNGRIRIRDYMAGYLKEYFLPEFYYQAFDPHPPFRRVYGEDPVIETRTRIRVRQSPLYVEVDSEGKPTNLKVRLKGEPIPIADWNSETGQIYLGRSIEFIDDLEVDYTYWVKYVEYGGFKEGDVFYHLDLCPHPGRTYTNLETGEEEPTSKLLEKEIYLYCLPVYKRPLFMDEPVKDDRSGEISVNMNPLRHLIVPKGTPESQVLDQIRQINADALMLARIGIERPHLPENVEVIDVRRRGGGISVILSDEAALRAYPQARSFWDFGFWDGKPYPSNSILIVTVHEDALQNTGEQEIRAFLERIVDLGVYPALRIKSS